MASFGHTERFKELYLNSTLREKVVYSLEQISNSVKSFGFEKNKLYYQVVDILEIDINPIQDPNLDSLNDINQNCLIRFKYTDSDNNQYII